MALGLAVPSNDLLPVACSPADKPRFDHWITEWGTTTVFNTEALSLDQVASRLNKPETSLNTPSDTIRDNIGNVWIDRCEWVEPTDSHLVDEEQGGKQRIAMIVDKGNCPAMELP